jgi:hypothetical protein
VLGLRFRARARRPQRRQALLARVYLFKRGTFYPFAPVDAGKERRDTELELRIRTMVGADLPVEADLSRWFPMWDVPVS